MRLEKLIAVGFRNIERAELTLSPGLNVFVGENAMGKTNLLEGIYLFSAGRSFRAGRDRELIQFEKERAELLLSFFEGEREFAARMRIFGNRRKEIEVGGVPVTKLGELMGLFPMILFAPEHLDVVKEGPSGRRKLLDFALSQLSPAYYAAEVALSKIIAQKNALLKKEMRSGYETGTLDVWNRKFAAAAAVVIEKRASYIQKLNVEAKKRMLTISAGREELTLTYKSYAPEPERDTAARLYEKLRSHERAERAVGACLVGPQRDDMRIDIGGREARLYASQGQQRSAVLAIKLSEGAILEREKGEKPIYLFDDVLSELDADRQKYLARATEGAQVVLTTCGTVPEGATRVFRIQNGTVYQTQLPRRSPKRKSTGKRKTSPKKGAGE